MKSLTDLKEAFIQKGEWDGSNYIIYLDDYTGVINQDGCTDIIAAYYDPKKDSVELRIADLTDTHQSWLSPAEIESSLLDMIYNDIKNYEDD